MIAIRDFPRRLYRFFLAIAASSYVVVVFLIKEGIAIPSVPGVASYLVYTVAPVLFTYLCVFCARKLPIVTLETEVSQVEPVNCEFLPSFLGYFFVALSVPDWTTLVFVYAIIVILTALSQTLYFNPLMLMLGYKFYYLTTVDGVKSLIITRKELKRPSEVDIYELSCINEFTYIDFEK